MTGVGGRPDRGTTAAVTEPLGPHSAPGDEAPPDRKETGANLCPDCEGSGRRDGEECPTCGGTGEVEEVVGGG